MKKIPKEALHTGRVLAEAINTPLREHKKRDKDGVGYFEGMKIVNGEWVAGDKIDYEVKVTRATTELSGIYPYIFSVVSYICTHSKVLIDDNPNSYWYSFKIPYNIFIDIALGGMTEQKQYLQAEMWRTSEKNPSKILPFNETVSVYAPPLVFAIGKEQMKRVNGLDIALNSEIQIQFIKSLFRDVYERDEPYINEPKAFYAKLVNAVKNPPAFSNNPLVNQNFGVSMLKEALENGQMTAFNKLWYYIKLHDNGKTTQIHYNVLEILETIAPHYIEIKREKMYIHNRTEAGNLILKGMHAICSVWVNDAIQADRVPYDYKLIKNLLTVSFISKEKLSKIIEKETQKLRYK